MSQYEPGLDLHEWETRWEELEPMLADDPISALPEACDFVAQALEESGVGVERVGGEADELVTAYEAAREVADDVERGVDVSPGDVGAAIANVRGVYQSLLEGRRS